MVCDLRPRAIQNGKGATPRRSLGGFPTCIGHTTIMPAPRESPPHRVRRATNIPNLLPPRWFAFERPMRLADIHGRLPPKGDNDKLRAHLPPPLAVPAPPSQPLTVMIRSLSGDNGDNPRARLCGHAQLSQTLSPT